MFYWYTKDFKDTHIPLVLFKQISFWAFTNQMQGPFYKSALGWDFEILLTIFLSFYSQRAQKPLKLLGGLSAEFCLKIQWNYCVRLVWRHQITNFFSKYSFCTGQRVVSWPLQPLARIAPEMCVVRSHESVNPACSMLRGTQ